MTDDLKLSPINYDKECKNLDDLDDNDIEEIKTCIKDLITYCVKLRPYVVGLAFEGKSSFLHNRRHKALHEAAHAMSSKVDIQRNKLIHLENILVMCGVYNVESLEKCIKTVHTLHSRQSMYEKFYFCRTDNQGL